MPNRPKSDRVKLLEGTFRPDRSHPEVELPAPSSLDPPEWLTGPEACDEWRRVTDLLVPVQVFTEGDVTALGHLCNLHAELVLLYRARKSPTAAQLTQLRLYLTEFGLTPASRTKAGAVGGEQSRSKWAEFGEQEAG